MIDAGVSPEELLQGYLSKFSLEDLETMQAIVRKHSSDELGQGTVPLAITSG